LNGHVADNVDVVPLYGMLDGKAQDAAIRSPPEGRRKVVLATAIAETSITIDGVRVVIDSGLSRLPRYEPASGLTRLETVRVSRASAEQRAGRAGRTRPGVAIRLWRAEQTAALSAFTPPEILEADLSGLLLDCAAFGVSDPSSLAFLDPPPAPALNEARALLERLDAIDGAGRLTPSGERMRGLALPVRLAHMVAEAAGDGHALEAAEIAVLLTERGLGGDSVDLERRLSRFRTDRSPRANAARKLAERLAKASPSSKKEDDSSAGRLLLHAWPDRVAKARGERGRFVLANGSGAMLDAADPLAGEGFLVVADLQGKAQNARISAAAAISEEDIRSVLGAKIERLSETSFDVARKAIRARETLRLGAITLTEQLLPPPQGGKADQALIEAIREHGLGILPWNGEPQALRHRLSWLHRGLGAPWPDMSDNALLDTLDEWLLPFMPGKASLGELTGGALQAALLSLVPHDLQRKLATLAPTHYDAPSGSRLPISYDGEWPVLSIRVQELFGLGQHPSVAGGTVPLTLELLSPAHRPIQTTRDLAGFWRGSWSDVRSDMRGRYPRHEWPEDPASAQATNRAKPRAR
jgi:ATP-dependent helicase HrpB